MIRAYLRRITTTSNQRLSFTTAVMLGLMCGFMAWVDVNELLGTLLVLSIFFGFIGAMLLTLRWIDLGE